MAAKGAAERTRMRRICRIGPIYGATCHRGGFRSCEISPAMVPYGTEKSLRKRDSVHSGREKVARQKIDVKDKKVSICKKFEMKILHVCDDCTVLQRERDGFRYYLYLRFAFHHNRSD